MRAAVIQMEAGLGEVDANLERAERLVVQAAATGAEWVVLPEFFTSAMAFHDGLLDAARPIDGEPTQLLRRLAARHGITLGGSFVAAHPDGAVRNTFVLAGPDGEVLGTHDKDLPTMWENCYYEPGGDDGVIEVPGGPVGVALCWELIRTGTVRRLRNRVRFVVGGSCWWTVPENLPPAALWRPFAAQNERLCAEALPVFARLVGVPLLHANWCGEVTGRWAFGSRYATRYVQHAGIYDASGRELARRSPGDGPGVVVADIEQRDPVPLGDVPRSFWIHRVNRLPHWRLAWWAQNRHGHAYRRRIGDSRH